MRPRAVLADDARDTLKACRIHLGADFYVLSIAQVERLLDEADRVRYRKPPHANGSRARYFHDLMQRRAARQETTR